MRVLFGLLLIGCLCAAEGAAPSAADAANEAGDRVLLTEVRSLVLRADEMTRGRRGPPMKQLECIGNCKYRPASVMCENKGTTDAGSVAWKCQADLPSSVR